MTEVIFNVSSLSNEDLFVRYLCARVREGYAMKDAVAWALRVFPEFAPNA